MLIQIIANKIQEIKNQQYQNQNQQNDKNYERN
jgi:hypothetical protein